MEILNEQLGIYKRTPPRHNKPWSGRMTFRHLQKLQNGWNTYKAEGCPRDKIQLDRLTTIDNKTIFMNGNIAKIKGTLKASEAVRVADTDDYSIPRFERGIKTIGSSNNPIAKKLLGDGVPTFIPEQEREIPVFYKNQIVGLEGCPGGGKSTKCADIIELFSQKYIIFYFTPTHEQINNMAAKLIKKHLNFIIMSDESRLLENITQYHTSNKKGYNPLAKNAIPRHAKIILSTTNKPLLKLNRIGPCVTIIDEAGRVSLLEAVTAISELKHLKFLLLAGDTKQLGCHTTHKTRIVSILEHIRTCTAHLWKVRGQYRFDSILNYLISIAFYESEMRSLKLVKSRCALVEIWGCGHSTDANSCEVEANICATIAKVLSMSGTTVITPYRSQQLELERANQKSITIDTAQGSEFSRVILSIGRAKGRGFLTNKRINVGMSRAKDMLIIVAHVDVVYDIPVLRTLRRVAALNNCLFPLRLNSDE